MESSSTELLIVVAGPSGTSASIAATRAGIEVTVIDRSHFPREKCCGDGLTTGALRLLDELELDPATVPSWKTIDDVVVRSPTGREHRFPLPRNSGTFAAVARRRELDAALVDLAVASGADVLQGRTLTALDQDTSRVTATVDGPQGASMINARYVIAADGMWSTTRKLLGIDTGGYRGDWHAFRQYFTGVSDQAAEELIVMFEPDLLPGYLWSFPLGDGGANVGFGIPRGGRHSVQAMGRLWPELLKRTHIAAVLGPDAEPEAPHRAWPIPARLGRLPTSAGRVLFVGDAATATDPMTGEGIGQALETGRDAVEAIAAAGPLTDPDEVGESYRRALTRGMVKDHGLAGGLSKILANQRGAEAALTIVGSSAWTRRNFARWLFEDYPRASLVTPHRWRRGLFSSAGAFRDSTNERKAG